MISEREALTVPGNWTEKNREEMKRGEEQTRTLQGEEGKSRGGSRWSQV